MKSKTKWLSLMATLAVVFVLVLSLGLSTIFASADGTEKDPDAGRYYSDFSSADEAYAAVENMNEELEEEGIVLLKNEDEALPLDKGAKASVFGIAQDNLVETTGSIGDSLRNAGFKVNPTLENFYSNDGDENAYGDEATLGAAEKRSVSLYDDVGVVVIARGKGGESYINHDSTDEVEDEKYLGTQQMYGDTAWTHEAQYTMTETTEANGATGVMMMPPPRRTSMRSSSRKVSRTS